MNYKMTNSEYQECLDAGIPRDRIGMYNVESGDDYLTREYYENRLMQGLPVPDEWIPDTSGYYERSLKYQSYMMYDIEGERVNRKPEGFPDRNQIMYDDDELSYDAYSEEWIPTWMLEKKQAERKMEQLKAEHDELRMKFLRHKYEMMLRNHMLRKGA